MQRIISFVVADILKNRIILAYTLMLAVLSWSAFGLENTGEKGLLTLLNLILFTVPLVALLFSTIYLYNSAEFIELLLSQPTERSAIWQSLFWGLSLSLLLAFALGAGLPLLLFSPNAVGVMMFGVGCGITLIFVALAFLSAVLTIDKAKGIGIAIMTWLFFALIFDGLILFLLFQFSDYPIEKFMVFVVAFNPIDLSRILVLLHLDASALMGYTGAIFKNFFGTEIGRLMSFLLLSAWVFIPFYSSLIKFKNKDL